MFDWKWWKKHTVEETPKPYVVTNGDDDKVDEPRTPDISEPITSFIKCFNNNPRRFKLTRLEPPVTVIDGQPVITGWRRENRYMFRDTITGEEWKLTPPCYYYGSTVRVEGVDWLTVDELELIGSVIVLHYCERRVKLDKYRADKIQRRKDKERDRLTQIYKQDDKQC